MSKKEFLKKLKKELKTLPKAESDRALDYYSELIDDRVEAGATEEAAINAMGDIETIADGIRADAKERGVEIKKHRGPGAGWIILSILLCLICICALAFLGWAIVSKVMGEEISLGSVEWQEHNEVYAISKDGSIDIDLTRSDLFLGLSDDENVHLTYYDCDSIKMEVEHSENSLSVLQKGRLTWLAELFGADTRRQTQVLIPAGFEGLIKSTVTTGETRADHLICPAGRAELHSTTGDFIIYDTLFNNALITMTTGDLILGRCSLSGSLDIKGATGDADIDSLDSGDLTINVTTGDIKLKNVTATNIDVDVTTASISLIDAVAGRVYLHSTTGSIHMDRLTANDINLTATTGSISGTLVGSINDYTIESHKTTGQNSLPESFGNGVRKLFVKVTTGDINITFTEND